MYQTSRTFTGVTLLAVWMLAASMLTGCAPNRPAPVESRSETPRQVRPASGVPVTRPGYHRVVKGETLYSIAWRYGLDYKHLAIWNRIDPPYRIYTGRSLRLTPPPRPKSKPKPVAPPTRIASRPPTVKPAGPKSQAPKPSTPPRASRPAPAPPAPRSPEKMQTRGGTLKWIWPTRGEVIKGFRKGDKTRQGIRIAGRLGQAVVAAEAGKVVYSGSGLPGYGKLIIVKHNKNYLSAYGFNRKILAQDGAEVSRGERIADMGKSPDGTPLLHFEIRRSDSVVDPSRLLPRR